VQLLQALVLLEDNKIIHCDLKPENILLKNRSQTSIKVIDFGSSCFQDKRLYTYIQSRFYRAPEIILGIPYSTKIDIWSFGCILAELHTGYPLFPGESETEQLLCIMEVLGVPSSDLLAQASRVELFFDSDYLPKIVANSRGKKRIPGGKDLQQILKGADEGMIDLVKKCLEWDPSQRVSSKDALDHYWIKSQSKPDDQISRFRSSSDHQTNDL
jgi:dual specificity tyrosine-phosphorylation-regulated kinase 2/3/4